MTHSTVIRIGVLIISSKDTSCRAKNSHKPGNFLLNFLERQQELLKLTLRALEAHLSTINSPTCRSRPTAIFADFANP
jgi:hypothetical protein